MMGTVAQARHFWQLMAETLKAHDEVERERYERSAANEWQGQKRRRRRVSKYADG